jgi:hypothetical protein
MKHFRLCRGGMDALNVYREDSACTDILAVCWAEDMRVT